LNGEKKNSPRSARPRNSTEKPVQAKKTTRAKTAGKRKVKKKRSSGPPDRREGGGKKGPTTVAQSCPEKKKSEDQSGGKKKGEKKAPGEVEGQARGENPPNPVKGGISPRKGGINSRKEKKKKCDVGGKNRNGEAKKKSKKKKFANKTKNWGVKKRGTCHTQRVKGLCLLKEGEEKAKKEGEEVTNSRSFRRRPRKKVDF